MEYTIDVIDTVNETHVVALEYAAAKSLHLKWRGSDKKDGINILPSSLFFTLEAHISNYKDAMFRHLFVASETRYKIKFYETDSEATIWTGFLLPESYQEPYTNETFYVNLEATDGLGRLKGLYLSEDFYTEEKTVPQVFNACLGLTGLELHVHFAPAIKNSLRSTYNGIYVDGVNFVKSGKKFNAHQILKKLMADMLCQVRQVDNAWYIEGFNQLHKVKVTYDNYDDSGVYVDTTDTLKLLKSFEPLGTPVVTVVSPYKKVSVTHKREPQALPKTIAVEANDGWVIGQGVNGDVFPTHWYGNNGYYPKALAPVYKVTLPTYNGTAYQTSNYINLLKKVYVKQYDKLLFSAKFSAPISAYNIDTKEVTSNGVRIDILLNDAVLYSVSKSFENVALEFQFDLYASNSGLLDVKIFQPFFMGTLSENTYSSYINIDVMKLEKIGAIKEEEFTNIVAQDFTLEEEVPLTFSDDFTGFSKAFRLQKLNEKSTLYNDISVPVLYGREFLNEDFIVLNLFGANLVWDNIESVYYNGQLLADLQVFYNWKNGEEMAIKVPFSITTGTIVVRRYKIKDVTENRAYWEQWSDAIYPIETDRYAEVVANVTRRMYLGAFEKVDFTCEAAYKINDIIRFNYVLLNNYFLTAISWDIDGGVSSGTMVKCVYQDQLNDNDGGTTGEGGDTGTGDTGNVNQPPIVNAGEDVVLVGTNQVQLNAVAYDPDGEIVSVYWSSSNSSAGDGISDRNILNPVITKLIGGYDTIWKVTVTDDEGATAFDTVIIRKQLSYGLDVNDVINSRESSGDDWEGVTKSEIGFNQELGDNIIVTIKGSFNLDIIEIPSNGHLGVVCIFSIYKNGVRIVYNTIEERRNPIKKTGDFEFNYVQGDLIEIEIYANRHKFGLTNSFLDFKSEYEINSVVVQGGLAVVNGYPVGRTAHFDYPSWVA